MKFNYKNRGFVVITLSAMLVVVGVANYQLSKEVSTRCIRGI